MPHLPEQASSIEKGTDRDYLERRVSEMEREFSSFRDHYKDLSQFVDPRRGRFFLEDRNRGDKRFKNIINNKATLALTTATAGMLAGSMSPSRPWVRFTLLDKDILNDEQVKQWLELFQKIILLVFAKSNFYKMAPTMLRELLLFGTGCMTHVDDFDDVARFYTHTVGSYFVANNSKLNIDTLARRFQLTTYQMVQRYGKENVSKEVMNAFNSGNYGTWHTVTQFIELNPFREEDRARINSEFLPFRSVYFEHGRNKGTNKGKFLEKKGFKGFPAYVPRWETTGEDVYATNCPGMSTLGDTKGLQRLERELAKSQAKASTPPLQGPASMKNQPFTNLPGGVNINTATGQTIEPLYKVDPHTQEMLMDIDRTERRISDGYFNSLFRAITDMQGIQPKNQLQLTQINEERLLQLGPVLEQIHGEWLDKMVRRTSMQVLDAGIMPEAPPKLQGLELELEFISALAIAQRSVATSAIERTVGFAGSLLEGGWDVTKKINADAALEEYSDLVGSPSRIMVPDEEVEEARRLEQEQLERAQRMEMAAQGANIMKAAADSKTGEQNALTAATGGTK